MDDGVDETKQLVAQQEQAMNVSVQSMHTRID